MSDKISEQNTAHAEGSEESGLQEKAGEVTEKTEKVEEAVDDSCMDSDGDVLPASDSGGTVTDTEEISEKIEEMPEQDEKKSSKKKGFIIAGTVMAVLLVIYFGFTAFFMNHFLFGTQINGKGVAGKTTADVEKYLAGQVEGYQLKMQTIDGFEETISGSDIDLRYKPGTEVKQALKKQNAFLWFMSFFSESNRKVTVSVEYDQTKLAEYISGLSCMKAENQIPSSNAIPTFDGTQYVITPEVIGTQINAEKFNAEVSQAVTQFQTSLNMEKNECYTFPKYVKDSQEVAAARDTLNKYITASITYNMGDTPEVVDKALISTWLSVDENMAVTFNKDAVGAYLDEFCGKYNTIGATRTITTPTGKTAEVSGGIYGWKINREKEYDTLIANIEAGEVVTRDPVYSQTAASHGANDWGSTYIEVDLSTQQMWYVVDGNVAFQTAVVTGLPKNGRTTPQGVNPILEKMRNKTLRGNKKPDGTYEYETPVDYWMRVTWTGIGFHDATWQPAFGGTLYKTRGSHGCINMSYSDAAALYGMIAVGQPVIIHY